MLFRSVLGHEGYPPLLPLLETESGHPDGPLPLPFDADACDVIQPQTPALLSLACLGGLLACQEIVALHFGSHKPTARLDARSLPQLLHDVGLRAPQKAEQLEALASRLSTEGEDGSMVLEAGPVAHGFTGARLKLERLQAALLYATGSVATSTFSQGSGNNGEASISAALIDDDCAERLESALDAALVPIPVPVNSHPLVVEARRVLTDGKWPPSGVSPLSSLDRTSPKWAIIPLQLQRAPPMRLQRMISTVVLAVRPQMEL